MKETYSKPLVEVAQFCSTDVVTTSTFVPPIDNLEGEDD